MTTDPIAIAQRAIGAHDLPLSARLVLAWLALAHGGQAWLFHREIAAAIAVDVTTVAGALLTLQRAGAVTVSERRSCDRRRLYVVCL